MLQRKRSLQFVLKKKRVEGGWNRKEVERKGARGKGAAGGTI